MGEQTKIEWCDHSWSPWRGCTKISPGWANCYADALATRFGPTWGNWGKGKPRVRAKNWNDPVRWDKAGHVCVECGATTFGDTCLAGQCRGKTHRPTVFPALCDWLDEEVPVEWLAQFLDLIRRTPNLTWLLLTKRPENWDLRITEALGFCLMQHASKSGPLRDWIASWKGGTPPANVWVGTSVEDQIRADERIPALLRIPAVGRFISAEPLLGTVDLAYTCFNGSDSFGAMPGIHWVIVGGESGPGSRPCNVDWIRSLVGQCRGAGVPVFVKQLGAIATFRSAVGTTVTLGRSHPKGGDPAEWPEDLRVREFPWGAAR